MRRAGAVSFRAPRSKRGNFHPQRRKFATLKATFRSGLEEKMANIIAAAGLPVYFEAYRIPWTQPAKARHYTPDLTLPNGIIIETKGLFQTDDRQKHVTIKAQHPDLDIRFVFSNANAHIAKNSKTTYASWANDKGFKWAHKTIPPEWLTEGPNAKSLAALGALGFFPTNEVSS